MIKALPLMVLIVYVLVFSIASSLVSQKFFRSFMILSAVFPSGHLNHSIADVIQRVRFKPSQDYIKG
jgi:hypothetical protein